MGSRNTFVQSLLDKKLVKYTLVGAAAFTTTGVASADSVTYVPNVNVTVDQSDATPSYTLNLSGQRKVQWLLGIRRDVWLL